jgi:hypothetical protein
MDRVGLFDESLHFAMDYEYWLRLHRVSAALVHVPEYLACSRVHSETKTLKQRLNVLGEILQVARKHAGDASFSQYFAYWHHRCHERSEGWPSWLGRLPNIHWWLAYLHRRLYRLNSNPRFL